MNRTFVPALIAISGMIGAGAEAQSSTVFTYQGELTSAGDPANGAHDMQFSLWNALSGGGQFGGTLTRDDVVVTEGLFSVQLDFGAGAFDNANRWLEIRVNGFTLAPRTMITRSPYSIQTRGIFVDDAENVGIGTTAPASKLHVGGDVMANGNVYSLNPNNPGAVAFLGWGSDSAGDDVARIRIGGEGPGATNGLDIQRTADRSLMRIQNNGSVGIGTSEPGALLDVAGDGNFAGPLGVGGPSSLFGELTVVDSGHGLPFAIDAEWSHNSFPTIFASNSGSGGVLWAQGNSDVALAGGGTIVTGDLGGANIGIDNNEIMARNAGSPAPLFLNAEGGDVNFGTHRIHPAHAYAKIRSNGTIVSRSPNVTGASWSEFDALFVTIEGGVLASDIIIASDAHANSAAYTIAASAESGQVRIQCYHPSFGWGAHDVQFVIYRP